jgi:type II secretory pathway pseudopilin PulG
MSVVLSVLLTIIAIASGGAVAALAAQLHRAKIRLQEADRAAEALRQYRARIDQLRAETVALAQRIEVAATEDRKKIDWLDHQQQEIDWLRAELEKRPKVIQKRYRIVTLGVKGTGKTSLTLKWANPLVDLGTILGTKIERYERTVSNVTTKEATTEHVFEIDDWGGEHLVDAQQELVMDQVHGLLIVVDLAGKDMQRVDAARIQEQLQDFQPQSLRYFLGPKTLASCKAVVVFINKSDVLPGTPAEIEREARGYYKPLIDALEQYRSNTDVRVLVGSATYGHSTHLLFSHFVERILPRNAYDAQLLQRMKADLPPPAPPPMAPLNVEAAPRLALPARPPPPPPRLNAR